MQREGEESENGGSGTSYEGSGRPCATMQTQISGTEGRNGNPTIEYGTMERPGVSRGGGQFVIVYQKHRPVDNPCTELLLLKTSSQSTTEKHQTQ